jgi:hypothetical protein
MSGIDTAIEANLAALAEGLREAAMLATSAHEPCTQAELPPL